MISAKRTKEQSISTKEVISSLRANDFRLSAHRTQGRYICRIVDKMGSLVSVSSRSTLEGAVAVAVSNIKEAKNIDQEQRQLVVH